ncbi:hypothetical protein FS749_002713 [Ceratobasidium sp. UAMH 11750]|nr:hypothetical protein FS749_002713 [Ceratobasidium sp. UAMH 11750]
MRIPLIPKPLLSLGLLALTSRHAFAATGGSFCGNMVCVTATISGSDTIYTLNTTLAFNNVGWIATGFGQSMVGSPMVIMWPNSDGTITLSQREAVAHAEPQVVANPPRVASLRTDLSSLTSGVSLSFVVPSSGQTTENMIYAMSIQKPGSSDPAARLQQHNFNGAFRLDLTQTVPDPPGAAASNSATGTASPTSSALPLPTPSNGSSNGPDISIPYSSTEKKFIAHGVLSGLGFCFFLPIGVLQARFLRIWWPKWFKTHWIVQAGLAGPLIVVGFALAVSAVQETGGRHFDDKHMIIGLVLFLLYVCQVLYGLVIHLVKDPDRKRRPVQNYGHAILGLGLITLALYQVWRGFTYEWSMATGRDKPKRGVKIFWIVWIAVLGGAYVIGLALLPKQYKAEARAVRNREKPSGMAGSDDDVHPIAGRRP